MKIKNFDELKEISKEIKNLRVKHDYKRALVLVDSISNIDEYNSLLNQKIAILTDLEEFEKAKEVYENIKNKDEYSIKAYESLEKKISIKVKDYKENKLYIKALNLLDKISSSNPILITQKLTILIEMKDIKKVFEFYYSLEHPNTIIQKKFLLYKCDLTNKIEELFEKESYKEAIKILKLMDSEKDYLVAAKLMYAYSCISDFEGAITTYYNIPGSNEFLQKKFRNLKIDLLKEVTNLTEEGKTVEALYLISLLHDCDITDALEAKRFIILKETNDIQGALSSFERINNPKSKVIELYNELLEYNNLLIKNYYEDEILKLESILYAVIQRNNLAGLSLFDRVENIKNNKIYDRKSIRYLNALFDYFKIEIETEKEGCDYNDRSRNIR